MAGIAFLFPGQGAQSLGMARALCESFPAARAVFDTASQILGYDLAEVCWNGPAERLNSTAISQPAILVASWAALQRLQTDRPDVVEQCKAAAGLSLGEYTALAFAGSIRFEDAVRLVDKRGRAMEEASRTTPGGMCSLLGGEIAQIESICEQARSVGRVWIANLLCPGNTVVSGENAALDKLMHIADSAGIKAMRLAVSGAFHTEIMRPADERLREALDHVPLCEPRLPVVANVDAQFHFGGASVREKLIQQVISPVLWEDSVRSLLQEGIDSFFEIGPGRVLRGLLRRIERKANCENVEA